MIARARERKIDIEYIQKRKEGAGRLLGFWERNPRDPTLGRMVSRIGAAVGNATRLMRGFVDWDLWAAISAESLGTLVGIVMPLPPPSRL